MSEPSDSRLPDDWAIVAETHDGTEADLIKGRLQEEGIEVVVLESRAAPGAWLTGSQPHWAPKSIAVPVADAEAAVDLLNEVSDALDEDEDLDEDEAGFEPVITDPYEGDTSTTIGTVSEPFDRRRTALDWLRVAAWVVAALVVVSMLFPQCSGIV